MADPDAQPLTGEQLARMKPFSRVKLLRIKLHLTQEQFAKRYGIPLSTLPTGNSTARNQIKRRNLTYRRLKPSLKRSPKSSANAVNRNRHKRLEMRIPISFSGFGSFATVSASFLNNHL